MLNIELHIRKTKKSNYKDNSKGDEKQLKLIKCL